MIALGPLSDDASFALAVSQGRNEISPAAARRVSGLAANHPLYVVELARAYGRRSLSLPDHPLDSLILPNSLLPHLESVLGRLTPSALRVAAVMAVRASPSPLLELASLTGMSREGLAEALAELRDRACAVVEDGLVRLPHAVIGAAVTTRIGPARCALLHRRVADRLAKPSHRAGAATLARHYARAGDDRKAVFFARQATGEATRLGDNRGRAENLELVVRHCSNEDERVQAAVDLAGALHLDCRLRRALPVIELAIAGLRRRGEHGRVIALNLVRAEVLAEAGRTSLPEVQRLLNTISIEASSLGDEETEVAALVAGVRLAVRTDTRLEVAVEHRLRRMAMRKQGRARLQALWGLSLLAYQDRPTDGLRAGLRASRIARAGSEEDRLRSLNVLLPSITLLGLMSLPSARHFAAEAQMLARRSSDVATRCSVMVELGVAALGTGEYGIAEARLKEAIQGCEHAELSDTRVHRELAIGDLYLERNFVSEARDAFHRAATAIGALSMPSAGAAVQAGLGLCDLAVGSLRTVPRHEAVWIGDHCLPSAHAFLNVSFAAHMLAAAQRPTDAITYVASHCDELEGKCVPCWIRLRALEASLSLRHRAPINIDRLGEAIDVARHLRLVKRASELEALLNRSRR